MVEWSNFFASFISNLRYIHDTCTGNSMSTELYIGWPSTSESAQIVQFVDRLQFHDYSSRLYPDYGYTKTRIIDAANGCAAINKLYKLDQYFLLNMHGLLGMNIIILWDYGILLTQ